MWVSPDEARFPLGPTLPPTLGVPGGRPLGGTWETKDQVSWWAALPLVTGQLTTRLLEQPARHTAQTGSRTPPRLQTTFVAALQAMARLSPARTFPEVVRTMEHAPWPRGAGGEHVLAVAPHLRLSRVPS